MAADLVADDARPGMTHESLADELLLAHSFGSYRDLLKAVALHPAMGLYLSHVNNRQADPANSTFPDENFAREVMQLFSIGLFELDLDGSVKRDGNRTSISTYGNAQIREFAKTFTGLSYAGGSAFFGNSEPRFRQPIIMFDDLFNRANVAPFISRQLILRLVTSIPSPAYSVSCVAS